MNDRWFDKIEDYLGGKMNPGERTLFESEMANNKELSAVVQFLRTLQTEIYLPEKYGDSEALLRSSLKELNKVHFTDEPQQDAPQLKTGEEKRDDPGPVPGAPVTKEAPGSTKLSVPGAGKGTIRKINIRKTLAIAAAITGIVVLGSVWFLSRNQEQGRPDLAGKEKTEMPAKAAPADTTPIEAKEPAEQVVKQKERNIPGQKQGKIKAEGERKPGVLHAAERETLYAGNFKPDTTPSRLPYLLQDALDHYNKQEYKDAVAAIDIDAIKASLQDLKPRGKKMELFKKEESLTIFYAHYYKGQSYMAGQNPAKAIPEFRSALLKSPDAFHQGKTQWYLALACIKTGRVEEAEALLQKVAATGKAGPYRQKASILVNKLMKR